MIFIYYSDVTQFVDSKLNETLVVSFLREIEPDFSLIGTARDIEFMEESARRYLGDVTWPSALWDLMKSDVFVKTFDSCIRACLSRWDAIKPHTTQLKYVYLIKDKLPKKEAKQTEMF